MNATGRAQYYMNYLRQEGYNPRIDADGDVVFRFEGGGYYIDIDEDDEMFCRIVFPTFWEINDTKEYAEALIAAEYATHTCKVAKVYLVGTENVSAAVETYLARPDDFKLFLPRMLRVLRLATKKFAEKM